MKRSKLFSLLGGAVFAAVLSFVPGVSADCGGYCPGFVSLGGSSYGFNSCRVYYDSRSLEIVQVTCQYAELGGGGGCSSCAE